MRFAFGCVLTCTLSAWLPNAVALDVSLDVSQYGHNAWKIQDLSSGFVTRFAQTPDGYLWFGTTAGLRRFDGVRSVAWQPPGGMSLPHQLIRALLAARDGTLWIGAERGLASWKGEHLVTYRQLDGDTINSIVEDREGTVWIAAFDPAAAIGLICFIRRGDTDCHGRDGSLGRWIGQVYEDRKGTIWASAASGVWRWNPGPPKFYAFPGGVTGSLQPLSESATGALLVATPNGISQIVESKVEPLSLPGPSRAVRPQELLTDHEGGTWIATAEEGLFHLHGDRVDSFTHIDGLSGDNVVMLYEDREGNVWVSTHDGVDRFRSLAATTYSVGQGVEGLAGSVAADASGTIWISTTRGLYRRRDARIEQVQAKGLPTVAASLFEDSNHRIWLGSRFGLGYLDAGRLVRVRGVPDGYIDSIGEDSGGNLWIAHRSAGLLRVSSDLNVEVIPWTKIGASGFARRLAVDRVHGGLWLGFFPGILVHFVDGHVRASYSERDGVGKGLINDVRVSADGTVWAATDGGLSRWKDGRIATLDRRSGLPCDAVDSILEDDDGSIWLSTACGLVRIARSDLDAWTAAIDRDRVAERVPTMLLDASDGVRTIFVPLASFMPHVAKARDGKLWFTRIDGAMAIDPRHLLTNKLPPPVHIEQVIADRKTYEASSRLRLPPLLRDLQIDYTALSLVAPEKNQFRFKLDGRDRDWQDAGNRRQAFYTDLDPGKYRFRVIAANNSGVWNEEGASLDFSIAPAYWQTTWFRALCVLAFIALLWGLYLLRVRHLARQFNMTLDARVNERTRIARDLHDTLLQSFHGLLLRFQTAMDLLPNRATEAKQVLGSAIDQAAGAITEGRDAVQGLRSSTMETNDLADAIRTVGEELAADEGANHGVVLRVEAQGAPRALHPIVRDEILRIAGEALRNAFRHAEAKQIEVELRYDERDLRLRVRDDGKGIDPKVLSLGGREGHFGMHGMRERAKLMGGKLTVWSGLDSGTEVELSIPAAHAYTSSSRSTWRARLAEKLRRQSTTSDS